MLVVPIYNILVLPFSEVYLSSEFIKNMKIDEDVKGKEIVFLLAKNKTSEAKAKDFYRIGVAGKIRDINKNGYVVVDTFNRVTVDKLRISKGNIELFASEKPDILDINKKVEDERLKGIVSKLIRHFSSYNFGFFAHGFLMSFETLSDLLIGISPFIKISVKEKYELLKEDSVTKRNDKIEKIIYEYLEIVKIKYEAEEAGEKDNQKIYREMAIKKQMNFLQEELDKIHPENKNDYTKFEELIKNSGMNEDALKEATKVLNRFKQENKNSPEYANLYDYLDFITTLKWQKEEFKQIDIKKAKKILDEEHFGLEKVKTRIIEQIAIMNLNKKSSGSILLFVGPPGTGKTSIASSVAKALNRKYVRISLGGVKDESEIRGHRRTYVGAMPGRIIDGIHKSLSNNPVVVLDEIDKLSNSYNGDPASALLEVLDPEQNFSFTDHYLNMPFDLSNVVFICTANNISGIPEALLNRMEVIEFNGYTEIEKYHIAKNYLIKNAAKNVNLNNKVKITDAAVKKIITNYTFESGVRSLKRLIEKVYRKAALETVLNEPKNLEINVNNLKKFINEREIHHEMMLKNKKAGIVTGLAWTVAGGEILFIETMFTKGSGNLKITGSLGDVMKESCQIAISLVKSLYPDKINLFSENDLHIHVPAGSIPKDGPSAGVTITTSLASLLTGIEVSPLIAMTGEVSLRGEVLPIGGLPEKLMAAKRAKIKTVFIPKENEYDLIDVPREVKDSLNIICVSKVTDILKKLNLK